jgi:VWFA-related protein
MRSRPIAILLLGSLLGEPVPPAPAQQSSPPVFGIGTAAVVVDVVARDKKGKLITDMKREDFEVFEDGARQAIESFAVVDRRRSAPPTPAGLQAAAAAPVLATPEALEAPPDPTVLAFIFDRLGPEARRTAKQSALAYLDHGRREGDLVAVFSTGLALGTVQDFTNDTERIRAAIDQASATVGTPYTGTREASRTLSDFQTRVETATDAIAGAGAGQGGAQTAAANASALSSGLSVERDMANITLRMLRTAERLERDQAGFATTNSLLAIVEGLQRIPGRKTVVFFSEGMSIPPAVEAQFSSVVHTANRGNVSIYTVDAAGLRTASTAAESRDELNAAATRRMQLLGREETGGSLTSYFEFNEDLLRLNPHSGLTRLADLTGGFLIKDTNDAAEGFRQIAEDMRFHYVLGYNPTNAAYDGKFRNISVKVKRSGVELHARKGYFAIRPGESSPLLPYEIPALAFSDRSPAAADFPLGAAGLSFPEPARPGLVPVVAEVPASALTFAQASTKDKAREGDHFADFAIVARIRDASQAEVRRLSQRYTLSAAPKDLDRARQGNILFYREADLPPGRYSLEVVAYDAKGSKGAVRRSTIEVTNTPARQPGLSSIVVVQRVEPLPPSEAAGSNPLISGGAVLYPNLGTSLSRASAKAVGFFFTAYPGDSTASGTKATIEVLRADGTALGRIPTDLPAADAQGRVQYAGALPIDPFTPGSYTLKVTYGEGGQAVTRSAPFTVTE